jgi:hypothetical protein
MASFDLLDTPRRASLNARSTGLRASIKDWERTFAAAHDGKKPSKSDIKANAEIAAKYKEFQKLGDVLAGKLGAEALQPPRKKQKPDTVRRRLYDLTPRKPKIAIVEPHPSQIDPYDPPPPATPKRFVKEIAPTPQRDGKVLGLFDLLSNSGGSRGSKNTPSSNTTKRKVDALAEADGNIVIQTPSRKRIATGEDILQHLGSVNKTGASTAKKFGRTPASENKKFMLNHFFATPSAIRYANMVGDVETSDVEKTPLRNLVLGRGSAEKQKDQPTIPHDSTPVFLRRSHSFKERLASAKPGNDAVSPSAIQKGPSTLGQYRSAPKPISQIVRDLQNAATQESQVVENDDYSDDDYDDAMEAMRETETNVQVQQTLIQELSDFEGQGESDLDNAKPVPEKEKVWKKKGQKRTTRKSNMKPAMMKQAKTPKFVAAEDSEDETPRVEETQFNSNIDGAASSPYGDFCDEELLDIDLNMHKKLLHEQDDVQPGPDHDHKARKEISSPPKKRRKASSSADNDEPHAFKPKKNSRAATINPNAISHQNFKSLKIRGKTAKPAGAGGRGKFGRKR